MNIEFGHFEKNIFSRVQFYI